MATKRAAQAMGKAMGFMIILQKHLWLNLADLKEANRKVLRRTFQQQTTRSRSSSAPGSSQRRVIPRPAPAVGTATAPRQEPDVRRKAEVPVGSAMVSRGARDMTLARRQLLSHLPDDLKKGGERESGPAPKCQKFRCSIICVLGVQ